MSASTCHAGPLRCRVEPVPAEIRHILFTYAEALQAAVDHLRRGQHHLPRGVVVATAFEAPKPGGGGRFTFQVAADGDAGAPVPFTGEGEVQLTALITYCKGRGIPLSMRADKRLGAFGNRIGLIMSLGAKGGGALRID